MPALEDEPGVGVDEGTSQKLISTGTIMEM
jgi:hypothetical protein